MIKTTCQHNLCTLLWINKDVPRKVLSLAPCTPPRNEKLIWVCTSVWQTGLFSEQRHLPITRGSHYKFSSWWVWSSTRGIELLGRFFASFILLSPCWQVGWDHPHSNWGKSPVPVHRWGSEHLGRRLSSNALLFPMLVGGDHPHCRWGRSPVPSARPLVTALAYYDISAPPCTGNYKRSLL